MPKQLESFVQDLAPGVRSFASKSLPSQVSWFESADTLVAAVDRSNAFKASLALPYALARAEGRSLRFLFPAGYGGATLRRLECFDVDATVTEFDRTSLAPARPISGLPGGPEEIGSLKVSRHSWLVDLLRWAELEKGLVPMHRHNFRSWRVSGKIVLKLTGAGKTSLVAGVGAKNSRDVLTVEVTPNPTPSEITKIKSAVERGIEDATGGKFHKSDEHNMQMLLQRNPHVLELEPPLIREFPAFRPEGTVAKIWSRGFIDLIGQDFVGDIVVVETKLGTDPMLLLQAIDYWQWVQVHRSAVITQLQLHKLADVHIRLAVAQKGDKGSYLHPAVPKQLELLKHHINADVFLVSGLSSEAPTAIRLAH